MRTFFVYAPVLLIEFNGSIFFLFRTNKNFTDFFVREVRIDGIAFSSEYHIEMLIGSSAPFGVNCIFGKLIRFGACLPMSEYLPAVPFFR